MQQTNGIFATKKKTTAAVRQRHKSGTKRFFTEDSSHTHAIKFTLVGGKRQKINKISIKRTTEKAIGMQMGKEKSGFNK